MLPRQPSSPAARRAPDRDLDVSIVLPTLNEEESVGLCVTEAFEALADAGLTGEVVVVDNGCTDRSAEVARNAGARVVEEPVPGYGAAIRGGIRAARGRVVVMADADCTYPLDRVGELVRPVLDGEIDLCIGSRLTAATRHSMPFLHRFVGTPTLTLVVRQGGGDAQLTDSQSGYRAFGREAIGGLALRSTGMEFASEMLLRASQAGWSVREIPLGYRERVGESKLSTWRDGMRHLRLIMRLTPYQLLWLPGLALTAMAGALYLLGIVAPEGVGIGSLTWQPVFFASICLVLDVTSSLAASVVGYHLPSSADSVRHRYRFVGNPSFPQRVAGAGLVCAGSGLLLDGGLLAAWLVGSGSPALRLTLAGLAQGTILTGAIIAVFALLYRLLLDLRDVPPARRAAGADASSPEDPAAVRVTA
jgi:Glycosyl transferase family 2